MVARAALQRPWVFAQIAAALRGDPVPQAPSLEEQRSLLLRHHTMVVERHGDPHGTVLMRKFACRYLGGTPGARNFRDHICKAENAGDFRRIVQAHFPGGESATTVAAAAG